jgi:uncharacterized delta-60 repeat protein
MMLSKIFFPTLMLLGAAIIMPSNAVGAAGQLDSSFGKGGIFLAQNAGLTNTLAAASAFDSQGRILVAGQAPLNGGEQPAVVRLNSNGTLDTSFGNHGVASIDLRDGGGELATCLVVQPSGKIVVGVSFGTADAAATLALARFNDNGTLDTSFGNSGAAIIFRTGGNTAFLVQQPDGRLLLGGGMLMARTTADGILDTGFGQNGIAPLVAPVHSIVLEPDGKILAASGPMGLAETVPNMSIEFAPVPSTIARYNPNGTLDTTFATQGRSATIAGVSAALLQINGDIVAVGPILSKSFVATTPSPFDTAFAVARYNANGGVDPTFGSEGAALTTFGSAPFAYPSSAVLQSNGDIIAAGEVEVSAPTASAPSASFGLARYTSAGALDSTFGSGGKVLTTITPSSVASVAGIAAITLDANQRLVAVGTVSQISSSFTKQTSIVVARYLTQ